MLMEQIKKVKIIAILAFVVACLSLGIGYSSLSTTLDINGTAKVVEKKWDVKLDNIHALNFTEENTIVIKEPVIAEGNKVNFAVNLNQPTAMISFYIDIINSGDFDSVVTDVGFEGLTNFSNNVTYSVEGIKKDDKVLAGESIKDIKVILSYSNPLIGIDGLNQALALNDVNFYININKVS